MGDRMQNLKTIDEAGMWDPIPLVWGLERSQTGYLIDGKKSFRALDVKVEKCPSPASWHAKEVQARRCTPRKHSSPQHSSTAVTAAI